MKDLVEEHAQITHEVKQIIGSRKIVLPAYYGQLYSEVAHSHEIELTPDELLTREMLDQKMINHVIILGECTDDAMKAMENDDTALLQTVIEKTKLLQDEIHELQKIIYEDSLTKSYNRKWFEDKILDSSKLRIRDIGTLVMIDLNKFKVINDTYGHVVGDKVLLLVANKLSEMGGRVVRFGGDEFILIFDHTVTKIQIKSSIETLLSYFKKVHFKVGECSFKIGFAYGMASFNQNDEVSIVIEAADKEMYNNKFGDKMRSPMPINFRDNTLNLKNF